MTPSGRLPLSPPLWGPPAHHSTPQTSLFLPRFLAVSPAAGSWLSLAGSSRLRPQVAAALGAGPGQCAEPCATGPAVHGAPNQVDRRVLRHHMALGQTS